MDLNCPVICSGLVFMNIHSLIQQHFFQSIQVLPVRARALKDLEKKARAARHGKVDVSAAASGPVDLFFLRAVSSS